MNIPFRPLGPVMQLLLELGHEVTYAYDDLVFINNNEFLLQFGSTGPSLNLFFNHECPKQTIEHIEQSIIPAADRKGISITRKGAYKLTGQDDETMQVEFFDH
ncbi:MAG: hypothetical protein A3K90_03595 [Pelodictyon luteolum]|uniref:Uncharacterized protein n=2 Tax=Pelodictyon luteolum TaxID=1100 RepID=Q3B537_CHLL3|nr:hypothetical protein [Pelodictyon luteolum]ABB23544.1 conserved hypothetical protein [Pelodictyon luteolum DSM 273]KZK73884.1 MAG: hypothetical protein A3K90_03595 [Pelodictyon luteolum]